MSHKVPFPPDYATADTDEVPLLDWQLEILEGLLAKYSDGKGGLNTDGWKTWEEIEEELAKKH
ncbi:MAG TPA: hypothetical protein VHH35_13125 [Pyrinomonadaceae bacterium]|nr:hypothetical protein [Pyrinomonadaceae bacterium]